MRILLLISIVFIVSSCSEDTKRNLSSSTTGGSSLLQDLPSSHTGIDFINEITNTKDFNIFNYRNFYNGGGVGIGDVNNDGLSDIYFTSNQGSNKLYLNKGDLQFEDISSKAGIESPDKWSTGVTMVDINADGYLDIYVSNAGNREGGDQRNQLYINNQDTTFTESAAQYRLDENGYTTHAAFFDYDKDGDLDAYILNNSFIPVNTLNYSNKRNLRAKDWAVKDFLKGGGDKLLRNDGGMFVDVSESADIYGSLIGFGLGVTVGDVNGDNYEDIYVSNDFFERDYLYINNKKGGFTEELEDRIDHLSHSSMGADMADINNDGHPEIFVTDMLPDDDYRLKTTTTFDNINLRKIKKDKGFYNQYMHNTLQLNDGQGKFREISYFSNVAASDWSWGALMMDLDNNGYNDIFVCNGIINDVIDQDFIDFFANDIIQKMVLNGEKAQVDSIINKMPSVPIRNKLFLNEKGFKFSDRSESAGISKATFSNGAAYGDLDNDGDLDLVVNNNNQVAQLYKNNASSNYLAVSLSYKEDNPFGIGSKIKLFAGGHVQLRELVPSRGFQSSIDYKMIFGLDTLAHIDSLVVTWPNRRTTTHVIEDVNTSLQIAYISSDSSVSDLPKTNSPLFSSTELLKFVHEEDDYNDFFYERNIPTQLSKEGPCVAKGDVNGDGLEDLYLGASAGSASQLLLGTKSGFKSVQEEYFDKFKALEDNCAVFADVDGDSDLDLIVGSGGNNVTYVKRAFRDRIYFNNNGVFEVELNAMPQVFVNTSCIRPFDLDDDGDLDLFVGARSVPGEYGLSPGSFILMNNGQGQYIDVTDQVQPQLRLAGMITDATWVDVLPQNGKELVLVGEWMAPKVLFYDGKQLQIAETPLDNYAGWWQSVAALDVDNDGDQDLLMGNVGENFYLKASDDDPLFMWINDFDDNGSIEKIITKRINGEDRPITVKRDLADQLPGLKKENMLHSDYAKRSLKDLFPKEKLQKSTIKKVNYLSSAVVTNEGNGQFAIEKLNPEMQFSCINVITSMDIDNDGDDDAICAGNNHYLIPQFSQLDANKGEILINENGQLSHLDSNESGLNIKGTVRDMTIIEKNGKKHLVVLINDKPAQVYTLK